MHPNQAAPVEPSLSRRRLLINSAKATAGAAVFFGAGAAAEPVPTPVAQPEMTEEIAGHWTTF